MTHVVILLFQPVKTRSGIYISLLYTGAGEPDAQAEEYSFPRRNWVIALLLQVLISATYCIMLPSMHQLITNPTSDDQQKNATVDKVYRYSSLGALL